MDVIDDAMRANSESESVILNILIWTAALLGGQAQERPRMGRYCFFQEEPSFLENPVGSYNLFLRFTEFLLSEACERVSGIVYVLSHEQETIRQQQLPATIRYSALKSHLKFAKSFIGARSPNSAILAKNRLPIGPQAAAMSQAMDSTWREFFGNQSLGTKEDHSDEVVEAIVNSMYGRARRQLRDTELGRLFTKQLDEWIDEAEKEKKRIKKAGGDLSDIKSKIKLLEKDRKAWKKLKCPDYS
ncbi:uncharacterized protein CC84DRAFT_1240675 [Paraphaeosphaeria sporulosa]|uniref:Uncharacterized protein n=1 Tax=Paraphaeosphaeria sporulosa TaxID=1460663 RepID=A0A177CNS4_9PLEO|nr:uncharacterized protein CC84DRAFT_1240675 [Paraphaeosphaeria sporulosa]OAG08936.1 hypothetical protein CC84DRAFT_1240675 [Paraphaeosphaeria sporulosa]